MSKCVIVVLFILIICILIFLLVAFNFMSKKVNDKEKDSIELLNILMAVIEANKGVPTKDDMRVVDAEGLTIKFFNNAISTLYIYRGVNIPDLMIPIKDYPDPASVDVLVRATFETFLVFYYIFIDSNNANEIDLKYQSWELAGLYLRQNFPATMEESIKKLEEERKLIEELKQKVSSNPVFQSFTERQKNSYFSKLEKGNWRSKGWAEIALSAGFSELNSKFIYSFLCEQAHSGNISATQVRQSADFRIRRELMKFAINHLIICVANMIKFYCQYFPKSLEYYNENFTEPNVVTFWVDIGAERLD